MGRYELFLDESGSFFETSLDPVEQGKAATQTYRFPSQLAGLLAPIGVLSATKVAAMIAGAKSTVGIPAGVELHGTELARTNLQRLVVPLLAECQAAGAQPVRLVNQERVTFGDKSAIYTQMVAELVLQICSVLARRGEPEVELTITAAKVYLDPLEPGDPPRMLRVEEYERRIWATMGFEAVHRGMAAASARWRVLKCMLGAPKDDLRLQICDLISNASKDGFKRLNAAQAERLKAAFGEFDFSLALLPATQSVDRLIEDGSLGLAICAIAQRLHANEAGEDEALALAERTRRQLRDRLTQTLERLGGMEAPPRNAHLEAVLSWLNQLVENRRTLESGVQIAEWLYREVALRLASSPRVNALELDWFRYACHRCRLTGANHSGRLPEAAEAVVALDELAPRLAGRWEHTHLLFEAWVAGAVHLIDRWEYEVAATRMQLVDEYYGGLGALFVDALPGLFPSEVRSDMRGRALGTWVQAEIARGLEDSERWAVARDLSDRAIAEFASDDDKRRQYQYRCHLETELGCFQEAQRFLACSLGMADATLLEIAQRIAALEVDQQGFPLLHWMRHCAGRALRGGGPDLEPVREALHRTRLLSSSLWVHSTMMRLGYPRHGILRYGATVAAALGDRDQATNLLALLRREIDPRTAPVALVPVLLAGLTELAALRLCDAPHLARQLLWRADGRRPGAEQVAEVLIKRAETHQLGAIARALSAWRDAIREASVDAGCSPRLRLRLLSEARRVMH